MRTVSASLVAAALMLANPAHTAAQGFTQDSYTEFARHNWLTTQEIAKARGLNEQETVAILRFAPGWVYAGPCELRFHIAEARKPSPTLERMIQESLSAVIGSKAKSSFDAALAQTIMVMLTENLGRRPTDRVCRYALEMAEYETR